MSLPVNRPDENDILADVKVRVRILESIVPPIGGGGTTFCVGCYDVDPEFAVCVDLFPSACVEIAVHDPLGFNPADPAVIAESANPVGPYQCNYRAGFRLQARYLGMLERVALYAGVNIDPADPGAGQWTLMPTPPGLVTPTQIDTGWVNVGYDPTGDGDLGDDWNLSLGWTNGSILADGSLGAGLWCFRYIAEADLPNYVPSPQGEGYLLVSVNDGAGGFKWVTLPPGAVGEVLTIGAGGEPEWA